MHTRSGVSQVPGLSAPTGSNSSHGAVGYGRHVGRDHTGDEVPEARPRRGPGSWPWIVVSTVLLAIGLVGVQATTPCGQFHRAVQLSGSDERFGPWIWTCSPDLDAARATLGWDVLFLVGYVGVLLGVVRRWWPLYEAPRLRRLMPFVVGFPVLAGVLDLIENALSFAVLDVGFDPVFGVERFTFPDHMALPIAISTIAWLKWIVVSLSVVSAVMAVVLAIVRWPELRRAEATPATDQPIDQPTDQPIDHPIDPPTDHGSEEGGLGVCCSGGGIRAAAFSLGALERLEAEGVADRARWLSAVSGGNYAATAWHLVRSADTARSGDAAHSADTARSVASDVIAWLREPVPGSPVGRHRFLRNGPGGLARPIGAAAMYVTFNLVVLAALVFAFAWPIGRVLGSPAVQLDLRTRGALPDRLDVAAELWLPGVLLFGAALISLAISALPTWRLHAVAWRLTVLLLAAGLVLLAFLVVLPLAMVFVGSWMTGGTAAVRPAGVWLAALFGVAMAVWRLASRPVIDRFTRLLPQLGGVLLVVALGVWGGKVATDAAVGAGVLAHPAWWLGMTAGFLVVYVAVDTSEISLHRVYRKRLRRTFGLARRVDGSLHSPSTDSQPRWEDPDLTAGHPELLVCCAQQRNGIAPGGLPADTFTISARHVRMGDVQIDTPTYLARCPERSRRVVSWTATSGAAIASAMGRLSQGSTNALLAALNLGLGTWLPNPRLADDPTKRFGRVRLGYLFKEILGWYDEADRFVYVSDGGHWENLGLVELLRRRCHTIVCLDASGDQAGAFTTLRQAVELAGLELPDVVDSIDLTGLERITGLDGGLPTGLVATLTVHYRPPTTSTATATATATAATIVYARAQVASDLDIALRRYAKADPRFPHYSTGNQFLSDDRFDRLVDLGRAAGDRVVAELDELEARRT